MKPYVYMISLEQEIEDTLFSFLLQWVRADKKKRILEQKDKRNADTMLAGEILAMYAIRQQFGIPMSQQIIRCEEQGKPFLANYENIYFNISHSKNRIVAGVCDTAIGIDIQHILPFRPSAAKCICTEEELQLIQNSEKPEEALTRLWTKKEAIVKKEGCGLAGILQTSRFTAPIFTAKIDEYYLSVTWDM